jgi:hypothetical protein
LVDLLRFPGPHLTRTAHYVDDVTLALRGDLDEAVMLWVYAPRRITKVSWNGQLVRVARNAFGGLEGPLEFVPPAVKLPRLERWKYRDSLPEANPSFDDASFVAAAQTTSTNPYWNSTKTDGVVLHAGRSSLLLATPRNMLTRLCSLSRHVRLPQRARPVARPL